LLRPGGGHAQDRLHAGAGGADGQAGNGGSGGEQIGVGGEQGGGHGTASGQADDEDAARIAVEAIDRGAGHGGDRSGLALVTFGVSGLEPLEAAAGVVGFRLLRQDQREAQFVGQRDPSGAGGKTGGVLAAAMQQYHEGRIGGDWRQVGEHAQPAGVVAETLEPDETAGLGRGWPA
jgi:hypothetical protein